MAARKKKPEKISRVQPGGLSADQLVDYADLNDGDAFIYEDQLFIKCDYSCQEAVSLDEGVYTLEEMCGTMVLPVNIEVKWFKK